MIFSDKIRTFQQCFLALQSCNTVSPCIETCSAKGVIQQYLSLQTSHISNPPDDPSDWILTDVNGKHLPLLRKQLRSPQVMVIAESLLIRECWLLS